MTTAEEKRIKAIEDRLTELEDTSELTMKALNGIIDNISGMIRTIENQTNILEKLVNRK